MTARERLERLEADGAATFDGPGFRFVGGLLDRATSLGAGPAAERLTARAEARLGVFEETFLAARAHAAATLETLQAAGADPEGTFAEAFKSADFKAIEREASRALRKARSTTDTDARDRLERLNRQCRAQGLTLPASLRDALTSAESGAEARALGDRVARALFQDAAQHARSALSVARAADTLPDQVGIYNPQMLAIEALGLIESLSPAYLRALLSGYEDLAHLTRLPEPTDPRKRRRR